METTDMGPNESKACPSEEIGLLGVMLPKSLLMTLTFNNNTSTFAFINFFFPGGVWVLLLFSSCEINSYKGCSMENVHYIFIYFRMSWEAYVCFLWWDMIWENN
jgi:hypothetical protein